MTARWAGFSLAPHVNNTAAVVLATAPDSGAQIPSIAVQRANAGPRMAIPAGAGRTLTDDERAVRAVAPFIDAINTSAQAMGGNILNSLLGGNRRGNVLNSLWDEMATMGRDALGTLLGGELRRGMVGMKEIGGILTGQMGTLRVSTQAVLSVVSFAFALLAASQRKKQFGLGSILGGIGGFLLGGLGGAIAGYNVGNAIDNGDYSGALIGAATGYLGGSFSKASGESAGKSRAVNQNVTIYGGVNNAADLERLQVGMAQAVRGELLSTA